MVPAKNRWTSPSNMFHYLLYFIACCYGGHLERQ